MGISSSILKDQEITEFRKLNQDANVDIEIPTPPEDRQLTDKKGFVIFGILMLILIPFLIYALVKSDVRRLSHEHDNCGNLCGVKNSKLNGIECSGKDFTKMPYVSVDIRTNDRRCTNECPPGASQNGDSCFEQNGGFRYNETSLSDEAWDYTLHASWKFLINIIITTILCLAVLVLFRYAPGVVVWGVSIFSLVLALGLTVFFWYAFANWTDYEDGSKQGFLALALLTTAFTIVVVIIFLVLFKKIQLIIALYKETTKAIFSMPVIIFLPVITLLIQFIIMFLMVVTTVLMSTAADLTQRENSSHYYYKRNWAMNFAITFNIIVTIWGLQVLAGCQYMVLAGSIAQWFFKKNQAISPVLISFTNTMRFHLGTIAVGSFIITLIAVIKAFIRSFISNERLKWLVDCCCGNIEAFLKFLSKNAYVETAIHGQSFFRSGKRAAKLLITNAGSVIALNSVGDFVLAMTQFILLVISTAIAYGLFSDNEYGWLPTLISFFVNLLIVVIIFGVFETTVDTLFVCFCEDKILNDGVTRPYCMSTGLMQFVEDSKKFYKEKK